MMHHHNIDSCPRLPHPQWYCPMVEKILTIEKVFGSSLRWNSRVRSSNRMELN